MESQVLGTPETASMSAQLAQLEEIAQSAVSLGASASAEISQTREDLASRLDSQEEIIKSLMSLSEKGLNSYSAAAISGSLNVLGNTVLSDLGVTGNISTGLLSINGLDTSLATPSASITTLTGPLWIQKVNIDPEGNITTSGNINLAGNLNIDGAVTITANASEDLIAGDILYLTDTGTVAKASPQSSHLIVGLAASNVAAGNKVNVAISGKVKGLSGLQTGQVYYLGEAGAVVSPTPTPDPGSIKIGIALSDSEFLVQITN